MRWYVVECLTAAAALFALGCGAWWLAERIVRGAPEQPAPRAGFGAGDGSEETWDDLSPDEQRELRQFFR